MFFSREAELRAFKLLAERGFGPDLLATLGDGRVEQFLEGRVRCSQSTQPYQKEECRSRYVAHLQPVVQQLHDHVSGGAKFSATERCASRSAVRCGAVQVVPQLLVGFHPPDGLEIVLGYQPICLSWTLRIRHQKCQVAEATHFRNIYVVSRVGGLSKLTKSATSWRTAVVPFRGLRVDADAHSSVLSRPACLPLVSVSAVAGSYGHAKTCYFHPYRKVLYALRTVLSTL